MRVKALMSSRHLFSYDPSAETLDNRLLDGSLDRRAGRLKLVRDRHSEQG